VPSDVTELSATARQRGELFLEELYRWNQRVNLTTVPREHAWARHIAEPLRLLDALDVAEGAEVVDVGSGAGVPGIPLALARPDLRLTLLEKDQRRCGFLLHVTGLLLLDTVSVVPKRAEEAGHDLAFRERFDLATSRATAPTPTLCELALPLVRPRGRLVAFVTDAEAETVVCAHAAAECGGGEPVAVTAGLLLVAKERSTPQRYPRRDGVPLRRPLTGG